MKFHNHSLIFVGDVDNYIRPCSIFICTGQQLTYKVIGSVDAIAKTKSSDSDAFEARILDVTIRDTFNSFAF